MVRIARVAGSLDLAQHPPHRVDNRQQRACDLRVDREDPVAKLAEEILPDMGHRLQLSKAEKTAAALERVNRAKNARQRLRVLWVLLQGHEALVQAVQVLVTFNKKFFYDIVHGV